MIASTVWNRLITTLQNAPSLDYLKQVFEGFRVDALHPDSLPCVMAEPVQNNEIERDMNQVKRVFLAVDLYAFSSANYQEFPKTIVGNEIYKGILDVENDVRACLQSSNTLGSTVIDIRFDPSVFDQLEVNKYPYRGVKIPIKILYQQNNGV